MTRLQTETERLYGSPTDNGEGEVRALVLELARPADWPVVARLWQGVQADLGWPAPAIAVNGVDGYQLWFALEQPLPSAEAQALLDHLRQRYLPDVPADRLRLLPGPAARVPQQVAPEIWSAFVSADLAAVFADAPWLDLPPGEDAQAELLSRLSRTPAADVRRVLARPPAPAPAQQPAPLLASPPALQPAPQPLPSPVSAPRPDANEARQFLLGVMRDPAVALALRVEAAKALLS